MHSPSIVLLATLAFGTALVSALPQMSENPSFVVERDIVARDAAWCKKGSTGEGTCLKSYSSVTTCQTECYGRQKDTDDLCKGSCLSEYGARGIYVQTTCYCDNRLEDD
ncbi:hypothetical protein K490DRAFT_55949 [Saccharata proteae CBS 121410]|uniref:Uncharacterized protein n=1 Tax=Saccharata proteae CBS 121410 TaxID=1314787 RepID=A0A9P4HY43_9PEZI|nr:hypothetical protein K490DRAFT_55949 [Saccharata proteae CBS 121410]